MLRRRDEGGRGGGAPANAYQMQQRMFSIGDDFWIENGAGQRMFKVDGKALRVRETLELQGPDGRALYTIREKLVSVREVMTIEGPAGQVAKVSKALVSPLRERYQIELASGGQWTAQGDDPSMIWPCLWFPLQGEEWGGASLLKGRAEACTALRPCGEGQDGQDP